MLQQEEAFQEYIAYEASLECDLKRISLLSERLLSGVDYTSVSQIRKENYIFIHQYLEPYNKLPINFDEIDVPFCYPFLPEYEIEKTLLSAQTLYSDILARYAGAEY